MRGKTQLMKPLVQNQFQSTIGQRQATQGVANVSPHRLAKEIYEAFDGIGTNEQAVYRVLNLPSSQLQSVVKVYNATYKDDFVTRLRAEMSDNGWSTQDWQFAAYQMKRARLGLMLPKESITRLSIRRRGIKSSHVRKAIYPDDRVSYELEENYDSYQWYAVNDHHSTTTFGKESKARVTGANARKSSFQAGFPGNHRIVCRASKKGQAPVFYEHEQVVSSYAKDIGTEGVSFEYLAHYLAYRDQSFFAEGKKARPNDAWKKAQNILLGMGYDLRTAQLYSGKGGFDAVRIQALEGLSTKNPVIAFRGSQPTEIADILTDLNPTGVGFDQLYRNLSLILQIIKDAGGYADFTGHSLGGALAQYVATYYPGVASRVVTFQAPAIDKKSAARFAQQKNKPQVTHHFSDNDIVDLAGGNHLTGEFYRHALDSFFTHTDYMFLSPQFKDIRRILGISDDYIATHMGTEVFQKVGVIRKYSEYPHPIKSAITEGLRQLTSSGVRKVYELLRKSKFKDDIVRIQQQLKQFQDTQASR
ncbi:lipase family protein [Microscilla marina]|uniref:Lipase family n=1 Tax=Microscilla marina ATCC 23134 TaxID=313606 RepID=A1ZF31_MICM2|nr:lipase family [Microscilla marina]EAY31133.1 lipase family [Microscilla marina ATCC 23134]